MTRCRRRIRRDRGEYGSIFRLSNGWNTRGPATAPQRAFDSRVVEVTSRCACVGRTGARTTHARARTGSGPGQERTPPMDSAADSRLGARLHGLSATPDGCSAGHEQPPGG